MRSRPAPILSALVAVMAAAASACTCGIVLPFSYAEHRRDFARVFHGEVVAKGEEVERGRHWMRFRVIKDYSVTPPEGKDTATVWSPIWGATCGVGYPPGRQVLVFADTGQGLMSGLPAGALYTHLCARNAEPPQLDSVIREMEAAVGVRGRTPARPSRRRAAEISCGQAIFDGAVKANGAKAPAAGR